MTTTQRDYLKEKQVLKEMENLYSDSLPDINEETRIYYLGKIEQKKCEVDCIKNKLFRIDEEIPL